MGTTQSLADISPTLVQAEQHIHGGHLTVEGASTKGSGSFTYSGVRVGLGEILEVEKYWVLSENGGQCLQGLPHSLHKEALEEAAEEDL